MVSIELLPRQILIEALNALIEEHEVEVIPNRDPLDDSTPDETKVKQEDNLFLWAQELKTEFDIEMMMRHDEIEEDPTKEIECQTIVPEEFQDQTRSSYQGRKRKKNRRGRGPGGSDSSSSDSDEGRNKNSDVDFEDERGGETSGEDREDSDNEE